MFYGCLFVIICLQTNLVSTRPNEIIVNHNGAKTGHLPSWRMSPLLTHIYKRPKRQAKPQCYDNDGFPFEMHIPGYRFCGPGTKYLRYTDSNISPTNALDSACMKHDEVYTYECKDKDALLNADKALLQASSDRIFSANASFGERASAVLVTAILSVKMAFQFIGSFLMGLFN